jgi:hypothetical protein
MAVAENTKRGLFRLDGITGMLIATVLLLSILGVLTYLAIVTQNASIKKPYDPTPVTKSLTNVKAVSTDNAKFAIENL